MGDGFHRSKDPTNSIKVLKENLQRRMFTYRVGLFLNSDVLYINLIVLPANRLSNKIDIRPSSVKTHQPELVNNAAVDSRDAQPGQHCRSRYVWTHK